MNTHAYTPMHIQDLINRTAMEANILPLTSRCDSACIFCSHQNNPPQVQVLCRKIKGLSTMGVSVAGGISHNIGQILVAVFVVKNLNLLFYLPVLMIAGIITGFLIGLVAGLIIPSVRKALQL